MQATIEKVFTNVRSWDGQYGPSCAVKVLFTDESNGEYITKPDKAQEHIDRLQALVGKPSDFELEAKPDFNGMKQWKIKSYPGKPQAQGGFGGGGGGGRAFVPAYHQTAEGIAFEQERMDRRTALMQAVAMRDDGFAPDGVLEHANLFYKWLRKTANQPQAAQRPADAPAQATPATTGGNGAKTQAAAPGAVNAGPGPCPSCNAPEGKPHGSKCQGRASAREAETEDDGYNPYLDE